jgi:hypothetical protein
LPMPEHDTHGYDQKPANPKKSVDVDEKSDIIELSDIAVGTSQEDDAIIELTEELIGEAMSGISGATHEDFSEEEHLIDLSHEPGDRDKSFDTTSLHDKEGDFPDKQSPKDSSAEATDASEKLEKDLDAFFGKEQETLMEPVPAFDQPDDGDSQSITAATEKELLAALEVMIRNKYGDRIHHILVAAIEKIVAEEFERLKKRITESLKS